MKPAQAAADPAAAPSPPSPAATVRRKPGRPTLSNEELLDKALDLFLEQGFERTSIDAITAAAGMAKRTVYLRYGDKETLFKAALRRAIDEWILPVEQLQAAERDDLEETLLEIGRILVANIMTPAGIRLLRITNAEAGRRPEIGVYTYELGTGRTIAYLADLLRRRLGPARGELGDWEQAAIAYIYLVVTGPPTMTAWGMTLDETTVAMQTVYRVRLFLHGVLGVHGAQDAKIVAFPAAADEAEDLRRENERLKKLLVASMLETASLKERLEA